MDVKIQRVINGLTQKQLAKKVGVSHVTIGKIENGYIDNVKLGTLKKIAKVLNIEPEKLFFNK